VFISSSMSRLNMILDTVFKKRENDVRKRSDTMPF
jgi:hypothetical protein